MPDDPKLEVPVEDTGTLPKSEPKPRRTGVKGIRTTEKVLPYDSTHCYIQMGSAAQASLDARRSLHRVAVILDDVAVSRRRQAESLGDKIQEFLSQLNELELMIQKFEQVKQRELTAILSRAFAEIQSSMGWYRKMLEAHTTEDQVALTPLFDQLKTVVKGLSEVRQTKVAAALAMEERFSKSRLQYWNEKRAATQKKSNKTRPVKQEHQPYPVNSVVAPSVALDPKQLMEQAVEEIRNRDKLRSVARQEKIAREEHGSELPEE